MFASKISRSVAILTTTAAAALSIGVAAAPAASAADAGVCTVTGSVTDSGIGATPTNNTFTFNSVTISCTSTNASLNGSYSVNSTGTTTTENCGAAVGIAGTLSGTDPHGASLSGAYTGHRVGANVEVNGTINLASGPVTFAASLIFQPTNGICDPAAVSTANTTTANITAGSTAVVTNA